MSGADGGRQESRTERGARPARGERRPPRAPRADNPTRPENDLENAAPLIDDTPANAAAPDNASEFQADNATPRDENSAREKRSRDRYGRERRPRGERTERSPEPAQSLQSQADLPLDLPSANAEPDEAPRKSYFAVAAATSNVVVAQTAPMQATVSAEPATPAETTAVTTPEQAVQLTVPASTPVVMPVAETATPVKADGLPTVAPYTLPVDELSQIAHQSGLSWVSSDAAKVAAVQADIAALALPVHVPRERAPAVVQDDRPLVLVETKRDLRATTLPFEVQPVE